MRQPGECGLLIARVEERTKELSEKLEVVTGPGKPVDHTRQPTTSVHAPCQELCWRRTEGDRGSHETLDPSFKQGDRVL
jgi:hypothetical protein